MKIEEAKKRFGEKLSEIEDMRELLNAHYLRLEEAVSRATLDDIQNYYAMCHGMLPEDVVGDSRFPWHPKYQYGDAAKCCENCQELEMAITVNITSMDLPIAKWFPALARAGIPQEDIEPPTQTELDAQDRKDLATVLGVTEEEISDAALADLRHGPHDQAVRERWAKKSWLNSNQSL